MSDTTLTRAELADDVYRKLGISHAESAELVDTVIEEIVTALQRDDQVKLSSFGTFSLRKKSQRMGRNPKTKEEIPITARRVVTFHASNLLVKRVNKNAS